jgi:hypothetical protein
MMKTTELILQNVSQPAAQPTSPIVARRATAMKAVLLLLLPLAAIPAPCAAQAIPAASASPISTGFTLPSAAGTLQYAVSTSESLSTNYFGNSGVTSYTNLTGDLGYISGSQLTPFSMVFTGGRSWSTSGQAAYNYLGLAINQGIHAKRWVFVISDSVSYLPATPSTGLSGVPGVGDLGVNPVPTGVNPGPTGTNPGPVGGNPGPVGGNPGPTGANPGQGVLTGFSSRVTNNSSLSIERPLTGKTTLQASGSYTLTRFLNDSTTPINPGLDSDGETGSLNLSHRIDARDSVSGNFSYSRNTYSSTSYGVREPGFTSQTASLQYSHQLTRKLGFSASAGPQWTSIDSPGSTPTLSLYANLSATYSGKFSHATLAYTRSSNSGYGVVAGAISNSVTFSTSRIFDRVWLCALSSAYTQTAQLPSANSPPFTFHTTVAGVQVSRAIVKSLSAYASYTLQNQSNQGSAAAVDLFSGLSNVAGFGLTFSPSAIHLGHT